MASFKQLEADDFVISSDSISATLWSTGNPTLTSFYTSSTQYASAAGNYYLSVYQTGSSEDTAEVQFDIAYANEQGSGSLLFDSAVNGKSYTRSIYGQYRNLVLGDENASFTFGGVTQSDFYVLNFERSRYKEKLFLGSFNLTLTTGSFSLHLTDNSNDTTVVEYCDAGRIYQLVTGSNGYADTQVRATGYTANSGSYGVLLPDIGVALLNAKALDLTTGNDGVNLGTQRASNTDNDNVSKLFKVIDDGNSFKMNSEETISSDFIFIRARNSEFNYSENPSFISGSTGEVLFQSFINAPQTYVTTVGLYNDTNDLVAVAKLSRPLEKDFTKETLVRVKLDF